MKLVVTVPADRPHGWQVGDCFDHYRGKWLIGHMRVLAADAPNDQRRQRIVVSVLRPAGES